MLQINKSLLVSTLLAAMTTLSACAPEAEQAKMDDGRISVSSILQNMALTNAEKAEELADASERLVTAESSVHALFVAQSALAVDPSNTKARFWAAALAPQMELKGILARIEPFAKKSPQQYKKYKKMRQDLVQMNPERAITKYLLDGPADIHTERDIQEVIARLTLRIDEFRQVLNDIKDQELTIYINNKSFKESSLNSAMQACGVQVISSGEYKLSHCDLASAYERTLNRADFEILRQAAAGMQVYLTLLNGWDLTGIANASQVAKATGKNSSTEALQRLLKNKEFGVLRETNHFGLVPDLIQDAVSGVKFAMAAQAELCPEGQPSADVRPGYLFNTAICIQDTNGVERVLAAVETMLAGNPAVIISDKVTTVVDGVKAFTQPISDLRTVMPIEYSRCGDVIAIQDPTLGGIFPNGDFNSLLADSADETCYFQSAY